MTVQFGRVGLDRLCKAIEGEGMVDEVRVGYGRIGQGCADHGRVGSDRVGY